MAVLTVTSLEKSFGQRILFDKADLAIYEHERVGLIGANGSGKSTLFKIVTGEVTPEAGEIAIARSAKVGYLTQDPVFSPGNTVIDEAELAFAKLHSLSHLLRDLEHQMAEAKDEALEKLLKQYQRVQHEFDLEGGYAWRHRLEATLDGVGLDRGSWEQSVDTLSGGQQSRLALSKLLIGEPDLLLLDEPTNHLDLTAIEWLEKYLADFRGAVILISHDRFLLDRLATRIVWLNKCKFSSYPGNYSAFVSQRELQELSQQRAYEEQQADIEKQKEFIRRFGAGQRSKEAKGREKRLNRLLKSDAVIAQVTEDRKIRLSLQTDQRAGDQVLKVRELSKAYDSKVLWKDIGFRVEGERIGIIGPNGSGKTTLLEVLMGQRDADAGTIQWGANLTLGYYDQRLDDFAPDNTVVEEVMEGRVIKEQPVRNMLATLLFRGDDIYKTMGMLSGGERARVALAELLLDGPNVLILDEPTNHLDIASAEALEGALREFAGTILCVSHDRYFLNKIANRLLVLQPPGVVDFAGNYSAWQGRQQSRASGRRAEASKPESSTPKPKAAVARKDNPYLRPFGRLSVEELEKQITDTEIALAECQQTFGTADAFKNPARAREIQGEYEALTKKLEQLEEEYYAREA